MANVIKNQARYTRKNAALRRFRKLERGMKCWLHRVYPGRTRPAANGLDRAWFFPFRPELYEVVDVLSPQQARVRRAATDDHPPGQSQIVHTRRLKPFHGRDHDLDLTIFNDPTPTTDGGTD